MSDRKKIVELASLVGLKHYNIATDCGLHPSRFSRYLNNKEEISQEKIDKVINYLFRMKEAKETLRLNYK